MSTLAPSFGNALTSGGSMPIGSAMYLPDAGAFITLPDKTEWIRQSNAIKYSSKYSKAASLNYLQIQGEPSNLVQVISSGNFTTFGYSMLSACNNTGTIVIITDINMAGSTNGRVSTNGGSTWSNFTVGTNAGYYIRHVIWAGNRFVLVICTTTNDSNIFYYSAAGTTWTVGSTLSAGGTAAPTSSMLAYEPTSGSILCYGRSYSSTSNVARCTSGATFAYVGAVNTGSSGGSAAIAATNNKVLVLSLSINTNCAVSTDGGASFTGSITVPSYIAGSAYVYTIGNTFILNDGYYTDTPETASSWRPSPIPISGATAELTGVSLISGDRNTVYMSGTSNGYLKSTNGLDWIFTGVTPPSTIGYGTIPSWAAVYDCGTNLFILKSADISVAGLYGYVVPKNSAQYIGSFADRGTAQDVMYIRIY